MSIRSARCSCPALLALAALPVFGWAKPVPVIKQRLRNPRFGMMAVAAAGPGSNLVLAAIGAIVLLGCMRRAGGIALPTGASGGIRRLAALYSFILINIFLALFNLLPIPPFDGSHIVEGLLPRRAARVYEKLRPFGFPLLFLLLLVIPYFFPGLGIVERVVLPPVHWAQDQYLALATLDRGRII